MRILLRFILALLAIGTGHSFVTAQSQTSGRSVLDGIYTEAQAIRGETVVLEKIQCVNCHGSTLRGGTGDTPPLVGPEFIASWQGFTLDDLENKIRTMPPNRSDKMMPQETVDVLAFLLQLNSYPAGEEELLPNSELLRQVKIVPPKKP